MLVDYDALAARLCVDFPEKDFSTFLQSLPDCVASVCNPARHGDLEGWIQLAQALPKLKAEHVDLSQAAPQIGLKEEVNQEQYEAIKDTLIALKPWRKGPFNVYGVDVDAEWRSNLKWSRVSPAIDLKGKRVLDIGCGNGYYGLRMLGEGAKMVLGIDPSPRFLVQQHALKSFMPEDTAFHFLPIGIEHLPNDLECFDTTFSMGVFYHRRSAIDHLYELKSTLRPGGELILETLVVEGDEHTVLVPDDRYAMMRNVWFIPSVKALELWVKRVGFKNVEVIDVSYTTLEEQRATEWMTYHSLENFLDPNDHSKTIEGHPAPMRVVLKAQVV